MSVVDGARALDPGGWRRLRRPADIAQGTRWLFGVLALATLAVQGLTSLAFDHGWVQAMGLGTAAMLATSWITSYLLGRVPWPLDLVEAAALLGFGLSGSSPELVFAIILSAMWFRALYDSAWRSAARCAMYIGVVVLTFMLWTAVPGHGALPHTDANPGGLALIVLTVMGGRQLGRGLAAREQNLRMNAALAAAGSRLIGMTDETAIRALAWRTAVDICATSPGVRMVRVRGGEPGLRVEVATGRLDGGALVLPSGLIKPTPNGTVLTDPAPLNLAAGATLAWVVFDLPQQKDGWLLVGAPNTVPHDVILALRSLINQVVLALSNSDVHQELLVQASEDSLTGLANRAAFTAELATDLASLRDTAAAVQVLFLDLDDFKNVNDLLGHHAGDLLLREVASRLRRTTRPADLCARLGGDEFAVILRGTSETVAVEIAQRTVDAIAAPMRLGEHTAQVGASIGVATATAGTSLETLVQHADIAMYSAKARGKGRTELFHADLLHGEARTKAFERDLAAAAALGQLTVYYQPILTLPGLRCTAVEALVRWQHPVQGLLAPDDFIHVAEQTGAITAIGEFVLARACADIVSWQLEHPGSPLKVHVNVSARQLDDDEFITRMTHHLAESGLAAGNLVLELTESVIPSPAAVDRLRDLARLGLHIAIDDFGTGYASLSTLRSLPVSVIKLDRSFVDGALTNATDRTMITGIVTMSHELGLYTIAEGVERPEQREFLERIGTDAVQGYLHLRPVPAAQLTTWLRTNLDQQPESPPLRLVRGA